MDITESTEAGNQGYEDLLRRNRKVAIDKAAFDALMREFKPTDLLMLGGDYSSTELVNSAIQFDSRVHFDADHGAPTASYDRKLATIFLSTSGEPFHKSNASPDALWNAWRSTTQTIVLKENRGGSRTFSDDGVSDAPCFPTNTSHSVGVGDCFDAAWVTCPDTAAPSSRLRSAGYAASLYASTFDHCEFAKDFEVAAKISGVLSDLRGVRIPWELRPTLNIYLAAPDFPTVDTRVLDRIEAALRYHNFSPRRPIRENGLGRSDMTNLERRALFALDIELLQKCALLIAIPLIDDPGTFAELGWFSALDRPTILFDPESRITNLFVVNATRRLCRTLGSLVDTTFELLGSRP
jgi:nucleoside 2-deoxyribosyltransferase